MCDAGERRFCVRLGGNRVYLQALTGRMFQKLFLIIKYFITTYPLSLVIVALVSYLSLAKVPETGVVFSIPYADKLVHFVMYFLLSGMLWLEFLRVSCKKHTPVWHAWVGACLFPILFSGLMELMQSWFTMNRVASWSDFGANALGVGLASLAGWRFYHWMESVQKEKRG